MNQTAKENEVISLIQQELPRLVAQEPRLRDFILQTVSDFYVGKREADIKFDRIMTKLERDSEEQKLKWEAWERKWEETREEDRLKWEEQGRRWEAWERKWEETREEDRLKWEEQGRRWEEQDRKWEEQNRRWEEQNRKWEWQGEKWQEQDRKWEEQGQKWQEQTRLWHETLAELRRQDRRYESTIGALGARWGVQSEASFRNALSGILTESFGVEVLNVNLYDPEGEVFGRPDQVEIDVIIKNGLTIAAEIKSSIDKAGMYSFDRKVAFYARHENRQITRKIVISPMVDKRALPVAAALGIEIYSYAESVEGLKDNEN